jgi:hypothetical protein
MAADLPAVDIKAGRRAVAAMAAGLPAAVDTKADPLVAAIVEATPEAVRAVVPPALEALNLQVAILHRDTMAVDFSRPGAKPASSHRSPSGGSQGSLLLSLRIGTERKNLCGKEVLYKWSVLF